MQHIKPPVRKELGWGYWLLYDQQGKEIARVHIDAPDAKELAQEIVDAINRGTAPERTDR